MSDKPIKSILVTGGLGQLGSELKVLSLLPANMGWTWYFTDKDDLDINDKDAVEKFCQEKHVDTIINCAAYTAVDKAESDRQVADNINHLAVTNLAKIARDNHLRLVHVSTDYIFDGRHYQPYLENDTPNPQGVYGQTKLDGELALLAIRPSNSIIIRTAWVYSSFGNNFVKTMLRLSKQRSELGVVYDQIGSPTYARDLAAAIIHILPQLKNRTPEVYHYTNEGVCSWYDFAQAIFEMAKVDCKVNAIQSHEYPTPSKRPHYSVLNKAKIKSAFNVVIPYWKDSLAECLAVLPVDNP